MAARHGDLSDPSYEPTDDELRELSRSAFQGVPEKNAAALRRVHDEIAALRVALLSKLVVPPRNGASDP